MNSKKHNDVFDDILSDFDTGNDSDSAHTGTRFLKRSHALGERLAGEREEKLLYWVDPDECRMWDRHNRQYDLLTEGNCRDLIDGIRSQGRQEFPAIVRRLKGEPHGYEVICGARRHFAVSWLRANNYPQFRYLVEVRDLTDEEAFRLADIENRDREDISDFERARDYAEAVQLYYGGKQKAMAARLEVSETWLSRYLMLSRLPDRIVQAFASPRDLRELHARTLKPLLAEEESKAKILAEADTIAAEQAVARQGAQPGLEATAVMSRLRKAAQPPAEPPAPPRQFGAKGAAVTVRPARGKTVLEIPDKLDRVQAEAAIAAFLEAHFRD